MDYLFVVFLVNGDYCCLSVSCHSRGQVMVAYLFVVFLVYSNNYC